MARRRTKVLDVAEDARRRNRFSMRRIVLLIAAAIALIAAVVGGTTWFEPDTLAKSTIMVGETTYVCRIKNVKGELQAHWNRPDSSQPVSEANSAHLGPAAKVGTNEPKITFDAGTGRITFQVGTALTIVRPGG